MTGKDPTFEIDPLPKACEHSLGTCLANKGTEDNLIVQVVDGDHLGYTGDQITHIQNSGIQVFKMDEYPWWIDSIGQRHDFEQQSIVMRQGDRIDLYASAVNTRAKEISALIINRLFDKHLGALCIDDALPMCGLG